MNDPAAAPPRREPEPAAFDEKSATHDADVAMVRKLLRARNALADVLADTEVLAVLAVTTNSTSWHLWQAAHIHIDYAVLEFGQAEVRAAKQAEDK